MGEKIEPKVETKAEAKPLAPVTKPPIEASLDWDKAQKYLNEVETYLKEFNGKAGHNPNFILHDIIFPLKVRLTQKDKSKDLYDSIMNLKKTPPKV